MRDSLLWLTQARKHVSLRKGEKGALTLFLQRPFCRTVGQPVTIIALPKN
jgi:hypothetical protein